MKEDVTFDPIKIDFFGANAEMLGSYAVTDAIQQLLFGYIFPLRFIGVNDKLKICIYKVQRQSI